VLVRFRHVLRRRVSEASAANHERRSHNSADEQTADTKEQQNSQQRTLLALPLGHKLAGDALRIRPLLSGGRRSRCLRRRRTGNLRIGRHRRRRHLKLSATVRAQRKTSGKRTVVADRPATMRAKDLLKRHGCRGASGLGIHVAEFAKIQPVGCDSELLRVQLPEILKLTLQ